MRCGQCSKVLHPPSATDDLPVAQAATEIHRPAAMVHVRPVPVMPLNYMRAWRPNARKGDSIEVLAERLTRIEPPDESDASAITHCPHCGSSIASYVGRCPFCRHPLHGS